MIIYELFFPSGFADFAIHKERIPVGGIIEVDEAKARQMAQSQPDVETLSRKLPKAPVRKKNAKQT